MFLKTDLGFDQAGGTSTLPFTRSLVPIAEPVGFDRVRAAAAAIDWTPDLGARIGSREWWRGVATCLLLLAGVWLLSPGFDHPLIGATPAPFAGSDWDEQRAQSIAPLAWGATTGRRMAATDLVQPLAETPERPIVDLTATLGVGDSFTAALQRAGVGGKEARQAADLVSGAIALGDIKPGTQLDLTLGRRPDKHVSRPLEALKFRARFDLKLAVNRAGTGLALDRQPIAIDHTPLRLEGLVGASLYRAVRTAGAPAAIVESYMKALASRLSVGRDVRAADRFDLIIERDRAATGETRLGGLLLAGLDQGHRATDLMRWGDDGQWYDRDGVGGTRHGALTMPLAGRLTSTFGLRRHPILGLMRMHKGLDIAAPWGTPIHAPMDGVVAFAGRRGGYGNFIKLDHAGNLATGYGHMSRFAVRGGARVKAGEVIGYVGSTGLSTGPHLHWEVWRGTANVNPASLSFTTVARLSGDALRAFRAKVASLLDVQAGNAR